MVFSTPLEYSLYPSAPPMEPQFQPQPAPAPAQPSTYRPAYYTDAGYVNSVVELINKATEIANQKLGMGQPTKSSSSFSDPTALLRMMSLMKPTTYTDNSTNVNINSGNVSNSNNNNNRFVVAEEKKKENEEPSEKHHRNAIIIGIVGIIVGGCGYAYKYATHQNLQDQRYDVKSIEGEIKLWEKQPNPLQPLYFSDLQTIQQVCQDTKEMLSAQTKKSRTDLALLVSAVAGSALLLGGGIAAADAAITFGAVVLVGTAAFASIRAVYNWARNDYTVKTAKRLQQNCNELKQVSPNWFVFQNNQWVPARR